MRILISLTALALLSTLVPSLHAEVVTTLQFFGANTPDQTFTEKDPRIIRDSKTRDDATARASAQASADIGTGELTAKATGQKFVVGENDIAASAVARAVDTLTIEGPGTQAIPVTFQMAVDGDLIVPDSANGVGRAFATVQALFGVDGVTETATLQRRRGYDASGVITTDAVAGLGDWLGELPVAGNTFDLLLEFGAQIVPGTPFGFESELRAFAGTGGAVGTDAVSDFGNTGKFNIILPEGFSFTSESGVFLAGPVPEPQTWALLVCGLGCLAIMAGRRRRGSIR